MNKLVKTIIFLALCVAAGLALGHVIASMKNKSNKETSGYIGVSDLKIEDGTMTPEALLSMGRISDPQMSPDGSRILYGVSYTSISDNRSCRNLYICNADGSENTQLTSFGKSVSNARWSKDGKSIWFLQGGQLWKATLRGNKLGRKVRMSDVPNGMSEFKLSPDESNILYISSIKNDKIKQPTDIDPALDKAGAYMTEDLMYRHWDHWVTETPRSYVAPLSGKVTAENSVDILGEEPFELPTEPFGGAEQLDWAPDGRHIAYSCRKHMGKQYAFSTNSGIFIYDIVTGETVTLKGDGGYDTDPVWSPDGAHLAWISMPRDGYEADAQRILVCDIEYSEAAEGQSFGLEASNIREIAAELDRDKSGLFWAPTCKGLVFNALDNGTQKLFCAKLDGTLRQVTSDEEMYDFSSPFYMYVSEGVRHIFASNSSMKRPMELIEVTVGNEGFAEWKQITNENGHLLEQLEEPAIESVYVETVDGKQMLCWVLYPPQFDESKTYPAIEVALGGPQGTLSQGWSYRWNYRLMAQQGYVVILPNRRGTTAFGQEWKEQISGDYSGLNMQDYLSAGRYIKSKPYVDKLACVGASYGGYSVYMLEGLHGDLFDCFIAHAGIFDEKDLWFTTEEMWFANWDGGGLTEYAYTDGQTGPAGDGITFGGMQQAGAPYSNTAKALHHYSHAPSSMVTDWHTPILCIHGMMDFRIPYTQGMAAFNAAQMMGVPSKLVIFPEENHWILQPQNSLLWHREFYNWLERWMK